jgi:hypothetical protein
MNTPTFSTYRLLRRWLIVAIVVSATATATVATWQGPGAPGSVRLNARPATPTITLLNPSTGVTGSAVTITGTGFNATQGAGSVTFNGVAATVSSWSALSITVTVPALATTGPVVVTANGIASVGSTFTVSGGVTSTVCSTGTVRFVKPAATGSGNGLDWTNAMALPASPTRGTTYCFAGGSYGARTWSSISGTTVITLRAATVADHGTETGWVSSLSVETTQATFSSITANTGFITLDCAIGDGFSVLPGDATASHYGCTVTNTTKPIDLAVSASSPNLIFRHIAFHGTAGAVEKWTISTGRTFQGFSAQNLTVEYCLMDTWQNAINVAGPTTSGLVWRYNYMIHGWSSDPGFHGEWINTSAGNIDGADISFNYFGPKEASSGGMTGIILGNNANFTNGLICGNVLDRTSSTNGIITSTSAGILSTTTVVQNTFTDNINEASGSIPSPNWITADGRNAPGNVGQNNLIHNEGGARDGSAPFTADHNAYWSTTNTPSETGGQVASGNPFVNSAGGDFRLLVNSNPGTPLAVCTTDALGHPRTTWTRGAFEF